MRRLRASHGGVINIRPDKSQSGGRDVVKLLDGTVFAYIQRRANGYMVQGPSGEDRFMFPRKYDAIGYLVFEAREKSGVKA